LLAISFSITAVAQAPTTEFGQSLLAALPDPVPETEPQDRAPNHAVPDRTQDGLVHRSIRRGLEDQKQLYLAPFKPSNFKWDALMLGGAAALFATDMKVENAVPTTNLSRYHNLAAVTLIGTSASLGGLWAYGIKTHNDHAKETGELELEALANTFLIYTPMQLIAARERPDEGHGSGRFLVQHSFNTSFPAGHPMFTWTMASVVAHEYPKPWVQILAYGAASSLSVSRIMGRNHFASDVWVGTLLGYFIGSHIFHSRCLPGLSPSCHREVSSTE
jgi:membrane-associated phospholipid phosphatase